MNDNNLKYAKSERKSNKFEITKWKVSGQQNLNKVKNLLA